MRSSGWRAAGLLVCMTASLGWSSGQEAGAQEGEATALRYAVVSVRPANPNAGGEANEYATDDLPNGLKVRNATLREMIGEAYGFVVGPLSEQEVEGLPAWGRTVKFDMDAKVDEADVATLKADDAHWEKMLTFIGAMANRTPTNRMIMLRAVLEERFGLKVHDEVKEMPVYRLEVDKGGPKLKKAGDGEHGSLSLNPGELKGEGVPMVLLPSLLAGELGRPTLDATGLAGTYDFTLKWTPNSGMAGSAGTAEGKEDAPSLLTAVKEQLGLKFEAGKGPVHVTVVERSERPKEN